MFNNYLKRIAFSLLFLCYGIINGQTCSGTAFNSPGDPANCTYTYTSTGWVDGSGLPILPPNGNSAGQSICIRANYSGSFALIKGTFYVAPAVTFSGSINGFNNGSTLIVEGTMNLPTSTSFSSTNIFIETSGAFSYPTAFSPGGSTVIKNKGMINLPSDLSISGSVKIINYDGGRINVLGEASK